MKLELVLHGKSRSGSELSGFYSHTFSNPIFGYESKYNPYDKSLADLLLKSYGHLMTSVNISQEKNGENNRIPYTKEEIRAIALSFSTLKPSLEVTIEGEELALAEVKVPTPKASKHKTKQ